MRITLKYIGPVPNNNTKTTTLQQPMWLPTKFANSVIDIMLIVTGK
jgi:hypothetical protein